jgi:hypothetical protein
MRALGRDVGGAIYPRISLPAVIPASLFMLDSLWIHCIGLVTA